MDQKDNAALTVEANIPADLAGPVAVEASKRNISIADFIGAAAVATIYGLAHPFVVGIFGPRRDESGDEGQEL
jgi:hypothetical protein